MMRSSVAAAFYLVLWGGGVWAGAAALSGWASTDALDRALVGVVAGLSISVGTALVLAMVHLLTADVYLAVIVSIGVVALVARDRTVKARGRPRWGVSGLAAVLAGSLLAGLAVAFTVQGSPARHTDTTGYHFTDLVHWFRSHQLWTMPFHQPGLWTQAHPGNGELTALPLLFATRSDQLVYLTPIVFGVVAVLACAMLARELGGRADDAALATVAFLAAPFLFWSQAHSLATDLAASALLVGGVGLLLRARRVGDRRFVLAAGFALGFALGAKYTVLLLVPLVVIYAIFRTKRRRDAWLLAPGIALLGLPWFVRNWVALGNPVMPQRVGIGRFTIFKPGASFFTPYSTPLIDHFIRGRWSIVGNWFNRGAGYFGPIAIVFIAGIVVAFAKRDTRAVAWLGLASWISYLITPYTGGGPTGLPYIEAGLRYVASAALIGVALAAVVLPRRVFVLAALISLGFDAWHDVPNVGFSGDLRLHAVAITVVVATAVVAATIVVAVGLRPRASTTGFASAGVLAVGLLAALVWRATDVSPTTALEAELRTLHADRVLVFGVSDTRSILGHDLKERVVELSAPYEPDGSPRSAAAFDAAVTQSTVNVLAIESTSPTLPRGWRPPSNWTLAARTPQGDVYVRHR